MPRHSKSPKKKRSNAAARHSQRNDAGSISCPECGDPVRKRGMGSHRSSCKGREAVLDIVVNERLALQDVEVERQEQDVFGGTGETLQLCLCQALWHTDSY